MRKTEKIFGIGLSKTGTTSLYAALDLLGYRSATFGHMRKLGMDSWLQGDFARDYFSDYDAVTDLPVGILYPQLDQRYPGSKFILTVRDVDSWLSSAKTHFSRNPAPSPGFVRDVRLMSYGITSFAEDRFRYVHGVHQQMVKQYFHDRQESLLVMNLFEGDSWSKLCTFLGCEIPDIPFPKVQPGYRPPPVRASWNRLT